MLICPECSKEIELDLDYDLIGEIIVCPNCKAKSEVMYDEGWNGEVHSKEWWLK